MTYTKILTDKLIKNKNGRVAFEKVYPEIDCGRFPIKRIINTKVKLKAELFTDGHNLISAKILYAFEKSKNWKETMLNYCQDDKYEGEFVVDKLGVWEYTLIAWVDEFATWQMNLSKRLSGKQDLSVEFKIGVNLLKKAMKKAPKDIRTIINKTINDIEKKNNVRALNTALDKRLLGIMSEYGERNNLSVYDKKLKIIVEPEIAGFSAWYEMFPRSSWGDIKGHSNFKTIEKRLDYIKGMGFNVLYFPPIHPIGNKFRKGKNNSVKTRKNDVGSPWAIGSEDGGHKAVLSELGSIDGFSALVKKAEKKGISIAMDLAYQCSPDHPYVKEYKKWFKIRPDSTIQYAENPPKKYQDIYPFDFSTESWESLWNELKSIVLFWIDKGVKIFRVDNPHTKSLSFWEWLLTEIKRDYPDTVFLSEAFTRPRMMYRLAKIGFTQSYTYFAWRNTKWELMTYIDELTKTDKIEYFRPNFWPNTPDILNEFLQKGGKNAFKIRLLLAATLSSNYGIYGPVFELCENIPLKDGSEEYLNSEKYELREWNIDDKNSIADFISRINGIRNNYDLYKSNENIEFLNIDNEKLIAFSRYNDDMSKIHIIIINIDTRWKQSGWLEIPVEKYKISGIKDYQVFDYLNNDYYIWKGKRNYIELDPNHKQAHIFELRKFQRSERNFDYYI